MLEAIVKKILVRTMDILRDIGLDLPSDTDPTSEDFTYLRSDAEGIDIFCESILIGIHSVKMQSCHRDDLVSQYWYPAFSKIIRILRQ
jgi:hypothetical protein